MIGYPTAGLDLGRRHGSWRPVLLATASLTFAVLVGLAYAVLARRRRRRRRLAFDSAPATESMAEPEAVHLTA